MRMCVAGLCGRTGYSRASKSRGLNEDEQGRDQQKLAWGVHTRAHAHITILIITFYCSRRSGGRMGWHSPIFKRFVRA